VVGFTDFNPAVAAKAGIETTQAMFNAERKARQYNALRQIYGDAVGPDDTLAQLDANSRANQKLPGELEDQTLTNAGKRQTNAFNELMNPIKVQQGQADLTKTQQGNDYDRQTMGSRVQQQANTAAKGALDNQKTQSGLDDERAERERTAAQGIVAAVKEAMAAGEDPQQAFDRIAPQIAAHENVDLGQLSQLRQMFLADPAKTIKATEDYIAAARPNTALLRAQAQMTQAQASKERAATAASKNNPNVRDADVASLQSEAATVGRAFDSALGTEDKLGTVDAISSNTPTRAFHEFLAGKNNGITLSGAENAFRADLNTITSALGLDKLQALRAKGVSLGSVTEGEHDKMQASVSRLKGMTDPREIRRELIVLKHHYDRYQRALMTDLSKRPGGAEAMKDVQAQDAQSQPAPAAASGVTPNLLPPERIDSLRGKYLR